MSNCLNAVGFVFDKVKTYIKKDKHCKYNRYYCQYCAWDNKNTCGNKNACNIPVPGIISPCNKCTNNTQYKICIFKLTKDHFVSSSLAIASSTEEAWEMFKKTIIYQRNGNFVISVTDNCNKAHSFYANLIKAKKCSCCEAMVLYFKYNIISLVSGEQQMYQNYPPPDVNLPQNSPFPYVVACANIHSNITFNLKSGEYKNVKFYNSQNYVFDCTLGN